MQRTIISLISREKIHNLTKKPRNLAALFGMHVFIASMPALLVFGAYCRLRRRYLESGRHIVRSGVWLSAIRGREHPRALPEDHEWLLHVSVLPLKWCVTLSSFCFNICTNATGTFF